MARSKNSLKDLEKALIKENIWKDFYTEKVYQDKKEFDDAKITSLWVKYSGYTKSRSSFEHILYSEKVAMIVHPIREWYAKRSEASSPSGNIEAVFNTLLLKNEEDRPLLLKFWRIWCAGIGAMIMLDPNPNNLMLILIGPNNIGKSEFFKRLIPKQFHKYVKVQSLTTKQTDLEIIAKSSLLVVFDEMQGVSRKEGVELRYILEIRKATQRRFHTQTIKDFVRNCSFCGSSNNPHVIHNPEHNRRLIPIEITGRDFDAFDPISKEDFLQECIDLYKRGFDRSIDPETVEEIKLLSKNYEVGINLLEEQFNFYFQIPSEAEVKAEQMVRQSGGQRKLLKLRFTDVLTLINLFDHSTMRVVGGGGFTRPEQVKIRQKLPDFTRVKKSGTTYFWLMLSPPLMTERKDELIQILDDITYSKSNSYIQNELKNLNLKL